MRLRRKRRVTTHLYIWVSMRLRRKRRVTTHLYIWVTMRLHLGRAPERATAQQTSRDVSTRLGMILGELRSIHFLGNAAWGRIPFNKEKEDELSRKTRFS